MICFSIIIRLNCQIPAGYNIFLSIYHRQKVGLREISFDYNMDSETLNKKPIYNLDKEFVQKYVALPRRLTEVKSVGAVDFLDKSVWKSASVL